MKRSFCITIVGAAAAAIALACSDPSDPTPVSTPAASVSRPELPSMTLQNSGTTSALIAVSPASPRVVWASGRLGTYVVTTDGGRHWRAGVVPGAEALEFRDVHAVSANEAYLLSIGNGTDSRIYKTTDGGHSWKLQFQNHDAKAFYDCFGFWTPDRGIATTDAVDGRFPVVRTKNGEKWKYITSQLPAAQVGEASFASSGTCVTTQGLKRAWIATGGAAHARILRTIDGGRTWKASNTPIVQGTPSSGIFSVDFRDASHGILAGGELLAPDALSNNVAVSSDGGKTWKLATGTPFTGAAYGLSYIGVRGWRERAVLATGPKGAAWSPNEGRTWHSLPGVHDYWGVAFANPDAGWLVGTEGRILKIEF
jgi:photosystem II stability/assembly factor-like uncharacterized protein